jgi:hypothetical protein
MESAIIFHREPVDNWPVHENFFAGISFPMYKNIKVMKRIVTFLLLSITFLNVSAQRKGLYAGAGLDVNNTWITYQNSYGGENYNYLADIGTAEHLDVGYNFNDKIGFQAGVGYMRMGQKYDNSHHNGLKKEVLLHYVTVPIQLKYVNGNEFLQFYVMGGPQFMFMTDASLMGAYTDVYGVRLPGDLNHPMNRFEHTDIGITWSLGSDIEITNAFYINVGMTFYYGLMDINARSGSGPGTFNGNTWRWPDLQGTGVYDPSHLASAGFTIGAHYFFTHNSQY